MGKDYFVVKGAQLKCTCGSYKTPLGVPTKAHNLRNAATLAVAQKKIPTKTIVSENTPRTCSVKRGDTHKRRDEHSVQKNIKKYLLI